MFWTIWMQAIGCYVEWAYAVIDLNAALEDCTTATYPSEVAREALWNCMLAYGTQLAALANDFFGCFN